MAAEPNSNSARRNSNSDLLQELEALSQTLYQSHTARRTASLVLPREAAAKVPGPGIADHVPSVDANRSDSRPRSRRMSMSPWRSRPKETTANAQQEPQQTQADAAGHGNEEAGQDEDKKKSGIWNWKPMRALSHITMHRMSCLFSVEVIAVQGLPPSMNGLRLSVSVRKKDTRDGAVQTMPARVLQGAADFEETLFVRCSLYCSGGAGTGKPIKFEPRPFVLSVVAVDASELDFGKSGVDLSALVKESVDRSSEGARVRQWERSFRLSGKAKGGDLVVKLGFQIMDDGGVGIYSLPEGTALGGPKASGGSAARKQSKMSFSVSSPRMNPSRFDATPSPKQYSPAQAAINLREIDDFNLDDDPPAPVPAQAPAPALPVTAAPPPPPQAPPKVQDDTDFPEFEVVDKGVEIIQDDRAETPKPTQKGEEKEVEAADEKSVPSEVVVKEVVHQRRLTELDSIAQQIMALESMIGEGHAAKVGAATTEPDSGLDADEETVTREFLQMLEQDDSSETDFKFDVPEVGTPKSRGSGKTGGRTVSEEKESKSFVSDLGKGLGPIVQTKDGGYLAASNPFDIEVLRRETPKLAVQISKPLILVDQGSASGGFEVLQRMAAAGAEKLASTLWSAASMDEITGKTAEQVAFEGIASAIISGRNKLEGASSSAAKSVAALREMGAALAAGRAERVRTGIWNTSEEPLAAEDVLTFTLQRIESMAVEALKVQADMAEDEAPFDMFTLAGKDDPNWPLSSAVPLDEWKQESNDTTAASLAVLVVAQLRDPLRRYEAVGAPVVGLIQAARSAGVKKEDEAEGRFYKVTSVHVGGLRLQLPAEAGRKGAWDGQRQRQSAAQWLTAYGLGKAPAGRKGKTTSAAAGKAGQDLLWSLSSRLMADMWLRPMRNPDIKFPRQQ